MGQTLGLASSDQGLVIEKDRLITIAGDATKWSARVRIQAYPSSSAQKFDVAILCNGRQKAYRCFFVGLAHNTGKHSKIADVESWLINHCASRDIKWGVIFTIVTRMFPHAVDSKMTFSEQEIEFREYPED